LKAALKEFFKELKKFQEITFEGNKFKIDLKLGGDMKNSTITHGLIQVMLAVGVMST
jgi:hypothetical protein